MNCESFKKKLKDVLAAYDVELSGQLVEHLTACEGCRVFWEREVGLFRGIESGLDAMVNQQIPPSLLPSIRARVSRHLGTPSFWMPSWSLAVVALAVLILSGGYVWHRPATLMSPPEGLPMVSRNIGDLVSTIPGPERSVSSSVGRTHNHAGSPVSAAVRREAVPEVIVLAEERQAFARFVGEIRKKSDVAMALTRAAPEAPGVPMEIALLEIGNVEVEPLEETRGE